MTVTVNCVDLITDELIVNLPGASLAGVKLQVKAVLRQFLTDSASWRVEVGPIDIRNDKEDYYLDPPFANSQILYIHELSVDDGDGSRRALTPVTDSQYRTLISGSGADLPLYYRGHAEQPGKISVFPIPSANGDYTTPQPDEDLYATVSLMFREPWDELIPEYVMRYWKDVIIDGVFWRMFSQPEKPYSNIPLSNYHGRKFRSGIHRAREMARRGYTEAEHPVSFPRWA